MKKLFYILSFTWGIIINIFGLTGATAMNLLNIKPESHKGSIVYRVGHNWGGLNLGVFSFVCYEATEHTLDHEFGHAIQNVIYGPLYPFIVAIPSFIRYHYRNNCKKPLQTKYDDIWFEGQATEWGTKIKW